MLVGNKYRTVTLFADNVLLGRVKILDLVDRVDKYSIDSMRTKNQLHEWFKMESHAKKKKLKTKFTELTDQVYESLVDGRIKGYVEGIMIDVDLEAELKQCKKDNEQLCKLLEGFTKQDEIKKNEFEAVK